MVERGGRPPLDSPNVATCSQVITSKSVRVSRRRERTLDRTVRRRMEGAVATREITSLGSSWVCPASLASEKARRHGMESVESPLGSELRRHRFGASLVGDRDGNERSSGGVRVKGCWPVTGCVAVAVCDAVGRCTTDEADEPSYLIATTSPAITRIIPSATTGILHTRIEARGTLRRSLVRSLR
jgi:hypothetical protein